MAIDYGNYAQIYGGGSNMSGIADGITKALDKNKEARAGKITNFVDNWWDENTKNFSNAAFGDVKNWFEGINQYDSEGNIIGKTPFDLTRKNPMKALLEFKQKARKELPLAAYNEMLNAGHFNPGPFRRQYEEMIRSYVPMIEKKLSTYQQFNHLSKSDMQKLVQGNSGLQNFILDYSDNADVKQYALPDRTFSQWMDQKFGSSPTDKAKNIALTGATGLTQYQLARRTGSAMYQGFTGLNDANMQRLGEIAGKDSRMTEQTRRANNRIQQSISNTRSGVTRAQTSYDKALKKFLKQNKGKKAADFLKTPQGRELQERIARRTARATAANVPAKTVMGTVKKAIKKHGSKKVVQMLAKRMGVRGSIMLLSKLGLAGVMQAAPVAGQIAGGLLLAADAVWIVNTLSDLAE